MGDTLPRDQQKFNLICAACGEDFFGGYYQHKQDKAGHRVYCSAKCSSNKRGAHNKDNVTPWAWLRCRNVLNNLPEYTNEDYTYVGY